MANALEPSRFNNLTDPINSLFSAMQLEMLRLKQLRAKGGQVTRTMVEMAKELDTALQGMAVKVNQSELSVQVTHAYQLHRFLTGIKNRFVAKLDEERAFCKGVILTWQREEQARAAALQRELEAKQQKELEALRLEEAEHLEAIGDSAGAEQLLDEPVVTSVSVAPEKIEGVSAREYWTVGRITDPALLITHLAAHPDLIPGFNLVPVKSYLKKVLNRAGAGKPSIPGLEVVREAVVSNRNNVREIKADTISGTYSGPEEE